VVVVWVAWIGVCFGMLCVNLQNAACEFGAWDGCCALFNGFVMFCLGWWVGWLVIWLVD